MTTIEEAREQAGDDGRIRIWVNSNTSMSRGKYAAAAVHAALTAAGVHPGVPVVVLGGQRDHVQAMRTVIRDAGHTEVEPGTVTAGTDWEPDPRALLDATEPPVASEPSGYRAILIQKARAHAVEYRCYDDTDELVGTLVESANMLAADAPVQASTIVDEEALAGEISRHKLVHVSVSRKSAFCMCSSSVRSGTDDNLAWFDKHRAHALAEWLKEQGR